MTDGLPRLYTLAEVAEAMQCSNATVQRALRRHPQIRPVGKGRGLRFTLEDYNALVEAMRAPMAPAAAPVLAPAYRGLPVVPRKPGQSMRSWKIAQTKALLRRVRQPR